MASLLTFAFLLFAQGEVPPPDGGGNAPAPNYHFMMLLFLGVIVMFFVMSLPQKRERKRWNDMVEALKKNDRVLMSCGIIGKVHVVHREKNEVIIKVDDDSNTKMTFSLGAVSKILDQTKENSDEK